MKNYEYRTENSIKLLYHAEILHSSFSVLKLKKSSRSVSRVLFSVFRKKSSLFIHHSSFSKVSVIYLSRMSPYRL